MSQRRSLTQGLKETPETDPALEDEFVFGQKQKASLTVKETPSATVSSLKPTDDTTSGTTSTEQNQEPKAPQLGNNGLVPFTSRVRAEYAAALKRASLERQLQGKTPNTLQDMLEEALEPWLRANGYLP